MPPINHNRKKASARPSLDDIFSGPDEFGLLNVEAKKSSSGAPLEVSRFEEISAFVDQQEKLRRLMVVTSKRSFSLGD